MMTDKLIDWSAHGRPLAKDTINEIRYLLV